jgi:uncharacterized protein
MSALASPFVTTGPAPPAQVVGRDQQVTAVISRALAGHHMLIAAPRRFGKTSLIAKVADQAPDELVVVLVDLMGVQSVRDIADRVVAGWNRAPRPLGKRTLQALRSILRRLHLTVGPTGAAATLTAGGGEPTPQTVEAALSIGWELAGDLGVRVLVVLDEFQAITEVPGAQERIRSQIQHHRERVTYLFCGSRPSTLRMLFADADAPFFGQAEPIELGALPAEAAGGLIIDRFEATNLEIDDDCVDELLAFCAGHPQRTMLVADRLWQRTVDDGGGVATLELLDTAVTDAVDAVRDHGEFVLARSVPQAKLLRLAAWGESPYGAAARRLNLVQSSAQHAVSALTAEGFLDADGRLIDPLLAEWIRRLLPRP